MSHPEIKSLPDQGRAKSNTGMTESPHSSTGTGTSSSAERYQLDEFDRRPILLYKYRGDLSTSSQKDLCAFLDKDPSQRVTKKSLPRFTSSMEIKRHDLYLPDEKDQYANLPNYNSWLATVPIPLVPYLGRIFTGSYSDLYIVSHEGRSPTSSIGGSVGSL